MKYLHYLAFFGAAFCLLGALMSMVNGNYLYMFLGAAIGLFLLKFGMDQQKKAAYYIERDLNPLTSGKPVITDQKIIDLIREQRYDLTNPKLEDLQEGSSLEYQLKNWTAERMRVIFWEEGASALGNNLGKRIRLDSKGEEIHMDLVYNADDEKVMMTKEINALAVDRNLDQFVERGSFTPPTQLDYNQSTYFRELGKKGLSIDPEDYTYDRFESWDYYDGDKKQILRLERWGQKSYHAWHGNFVDETAFNELLPPPDDRKLIRG
ncbi:hypothetical protein N8482_00155 [Chitinophagales bacterium]|nr:hypothetical protein [Chitinophagales bacterium]